MSDRVPTLKDVRDLIERRIQDASAKMRHAGDDHIGWYEAAAVERHLKEVLVMLERVESGR